MGSFLFVSTFSVKFAIYRLINDGLDIGNDYFLNLL